MRIDYIKVCRCQNCLAPLEVEKLAEDKGTEYEMLHWAQKRHGGKIRGMWYHELVDKKVLYFQDLACMRCLNVVGRVRTDGNGQEVVEMYTERVRFVQAQKDALLNIFKKTMVVPDRKRDLPIVREPEAPVSNFPR